MKSSSGTSFNATGDPSPAEKYFVNEASPLPRSVRCSSAPRLVIKSTTSLKGSTISSSPIPRRKWNLLPKSAHSSVVSIVPHALSLESVLATCFQMFHASRRSIPLAVESRRSWRTLRAKRITVVNVRDSAPQFLHIRHFLSISMLVSSGSHRVSIHSVVPVCLARVSDRERCDFFLFGSRKNHLKNIAHDSGAPVFADVPIPRDCSK